MPELVATIPLQRWFHRDARSAFHPGVALAVVLLSGLWLLQQAPGLLQMPCPSKWFLGLPCLGCGAARSVVALLQFDIATAIRFSPLLFAGAMLAVVVLLDWLLLLITGWRLRWPELRPGAAVLAASVLHYAYLIWVGI